MLQARGADPRLYNPDRDLIWAMPRLLSTALHSMGLVTTDTVRAMMAKRHIDCPVPDEQLQAEFEVFVRDLARFLNELKDSAEVRRTPEAWLTAIFSGGVRAAIRTLVADLLLRVMFTELPIWFQSVQPENANSPVPNVEEVQRAVESILRDMEGENSGG